MSTEVEQSRGLDGIAADRVRRNLSTAALYDEAVGRDERVIAREGPLACLTGHATGRSPSDKCVGRDASIEHEIVWGPINRPMDSAQFDVLHADLLSSLANKDVFILDCYAGADPAFRLPIRVVNELAWHNLFARH